MFADFKKPYLQIPQLFFKFFLSFMNSTWETFQNGSWTHLEQSEGRHPARSALFVLGTQHPQFLLLTPDLVRLIEASKPR